MIQEFDGPVNGTWMEERVDRDFSRARRRAALGRLRRRLAAWLRKCCSAAERAALDRAACFDTELTVAGTRSRVSLGPQEVELSRIVGSVGRCRDFDPDFLPVRRNLEARWKSVERALLAGRILPPVKLYKIGERYFVEDGNHRVSAARYRGMQEIDAEVTELLPASPGTQAGGFTHPSNIGKGQ